MNKSYLLKKSYILISAIFLMLAPSVVPAENASPDHSLAATSGDAFASMPSYRSITASPASIEIISSSANGIATATASNTGIFVYNASDPFHIPTQPPETTIHANSLSFKPGQIFLKGNVKAVRETDTLTCQRAILNKNPEWLLASVTPRLYRKETISEKKSERETTLDANNILYFSKDGRIEASDSVTVTIEEKTWDLATYSKILISSDFMEGFRESRHLNFSGNVKMQDKTHFGQGDNLDYDKASSTVTLTGNARVETEKWNQKEKKMQKDIINGEIITYNLDTKQANSE